MNQKIVLLLHRLDRRGGQERSTWEVATRLAARGWDIELYSFALDDWPRHLPLRWHKVPGRKIPSQLLRNIWFRWLVRMMLWFRPPAKDSLMITVGTAALRADIRVIQFVHGKFNELLANREVTYPNPKSAFHRCYQKLTAAYEARIERKYLPKSSALIAISNQVKVDLEECVLKHSPVPIHVIHHAGIQGSLGQTITSSETSPKTEPLLLFVGALERKGIEKVLRCLASVKHLPWQFCALGYGDTFRWKKRAHQLEIGDRVTFFGEQASEPFFLAADIFFLPASYEPFGLAVSEAVSYGLAPLVSKECGALELWSQRPSWLKISCRDSDSAWVDALKRLVVDKELRKRCSKQAQQAMALWTWEKATQTYEQVLQTYTSRLLTNDTAA
ncbi:MAG: glycosyltransferase family 4 protein [Deltaproteobacteria bacterium]|nr:glycosyltransferase family 4 protein [Deltaproteobacteria bacterium]